MITARLFCKKRRKSLPLSESCNFTPEGFLNLMILRHICSLCDPGDQIIPCSSGGAFTVMMQAYELKPEQKMITNKGLASMGYGLSGAIELPQQIQIGVQFWWKVMVALPRICRS